MKILVDGMPRGQGGIGVLVMNLLKCARRMGDDELEFEFIIAGRSGYMEELKNLGYKCHLAPQIRSVLKYKRFVKRLFKENRYDFLWLNNSSKVNVFLPSCAKKYGTKVMVHAHGTDLEERGLQRIVYQIAEKINQRKMFSLIDIPLACSESAADYYYAGNQNLRRKVTILRNGVSTSMFTFDTDAREQVRKKLGLTSDEVLLGSVGRLTGVKNIFFAVRVLSKLGKQYKLVLVGDGEERQSIEQFVNSIGENERVLFEGAKDNVAAYLSAMDCFLLPSFSEGIPFSIIEAQSEGLPCIVSNTLTQEMKLTDRVEFLPINDPLDWVNAISSLDMNVDRKAYPAIVSKAGYSIEMSYKLFRSLCEGTT